jgi:hypothetical protein
VTFLVSFGELASKTLAKELADERALKPGHVGPRTISVARDDGVDRGDVLAFDLEATQANDEGTVSVHGRSLRHV